MKSIILIGILISVSCFVNAKPAFTYSNKIQTQQPVAKPYALINGKWTLININQNKDSLDILFSKKMPNIAVDAEKLFIVGYTGCNTFRGKFFLNKDSLSFKSPMASTMMACPGNGEQVFLTLLQKTNRHIVEKGILNFFDGKKLLMQFKRME
ncbi:MAG: META domain-containing protein [Sphingobacteriia bacterium]|nr:MAG: META domain-containing protein [Sphingobacteriia bacterium]